MDGTIFAQNLRQARLKARLTQSELAEKAGLTAATISAYESADGRKGKNPSLDNAIKLSAALRVSLDWLCGIENNETQMKHSDIIKFILKLDEQTNFLICDKINLCNCDGMESARFYYEEDLYRESYIAECEEEEFNNFTINVFCLGFHKLQRFFTEWRKMKELYSSGTIDENLYNLWINQQIEKFDFPVDEYEEGKPFRSDPSPVWYSDENIDEPTPTANEDSDNGEH